MTLPRKQFIPVVLLSYICLIERFSNVLSSDSDDDKLKEALVLVDLLKSEYTKLLRENAASISKEQLNNTLLEEATCAPTTEATVSSSSNNISNTNFLTQPQDVPETRRFEGLEPIPAQAPAIRPPQWHYPVYHRRSANIKMPYRTFRRRIPRDFYYYNYYDSPQVVRPGNSYRRFGYDDGDDNFGEHPGTIETDKTAASTAGSASMAPVAKSSTASAAAPSEAGSVSLGAIATHSPANNDLVKKASKKATSEANHEKKSSSILKLSANNPKETDPVNAQVAAELDNEIKQIGAVDNRKNIESKDQNAKYVKLAVSIPSRTTLMLSNVKLRDLAAEYVRTTRRIHLERSSRFPIPLPENHAFCFTNPKNALCRTLI